MSSQASQYSSAERLLHRLALSGTAVPEMALTVEKALYGRDLPPDKGNHVFVAGLARSGSTLLMRLLYETQVFSSLTYRDMPFVLCPNIWRKVSGVSTGRVSRRERAHGDGMDVDLDSPEALEEVFWRTLDGEDYIFDDYLGGMDASDEILDEFRLYVGLIMKCHEKNRYLSKNNNNILRLTCLARAFPRATILIPFRHPVAQAMSLKQQHDNFCGQQRADAFVRRYMNWLVHHEFGLEHKPFFKPASQLTVKSPADPNYWLELWVHTYERVLQQASQLDTRMFVSYERLCTAPNEVWSALSDKSNLSGSPLPAMTIRPAGKRDVGGFDASLLERAMDLHDRLTQQSI